MECLCCLSKLLTTWFWSGFEAGFVFAGLYLGTVHPPRAGGEPPVRVQIHSGVIQSDFELINPHDIQALILSAAERIYSSTVLVNREVLSCVLDHL